MMSHPVQKCSGDDTEAILGVSPAVSLTLSDSFSDPSCNFRGFVLHCQHDSFPNPSYNFHGFVHDFSRSFM